jgi:YfiH family protein
VWSPDADGVFQSELLREFPWLWHGFGSRLSEGWPNGAYTTVKQIHSNIVVVSDGTAAKLPQGDALITATPGERVGIRTADCVPILMADPVNRVVAAVHAGWRGTVEEIARQTVDAMRQTFDTKAADVRAAVGPCIAQCCFEVGPEVAERFGLMAERTRIDLVGANRRQLLSAGLLEGNVDISGLCTACDAERFHSFRRDKDASGRMVAAIGTLV